MTERKFIGLYIIGFGVLFIVDSAYLFGTILIVLGMLVINNLGRVKGNGGSGNYGGDGDGGNYGGDGGGDGGG